MANAKVRLDFLAMYRSLRATGCDLPVRVIPYDDSRFDLPMGAEWLEDREFFAFLKEHKAVNMCRKILALTQRNSAYFDSDIVHIRSFSSDLEAFPEGCLIAADPEWSIKAWTFSEETKRVYESGSSTWVLDNFNAGFFALGSQGIEKDYIKSLFKDQMFSRLCQGGGPTSSDQEAINYLTFMTDLKVVNLCLPPYRMESTFCWDYPQKYEALLSKKEAPFFIHFVSKAIEQDHFMKPLFFEHLTTAEKQEWKQLHPPTVDRKWPLGVRILNRLVGMVDERFYVQQRGKTTF
jgi:hypothetical protein